MSDKKGILAGVIGLGTALVSIGRDLLTIWREEKPVSRKANRTDADALAEAVKRDAGDGLAVMRDQIVGERSRR